MSRELVLEATPFGLRAGLLEDGRLALVTLAEAARPSLRGQVFLGRVRAVDDALAAAFVDCGLAAPGWLDARAARPLGRRPVEGQAVIVQGRRDPQGGKGPRLTGEIALPGPCLVYRPRRAEGERLVERPAACGATPAELAAEAERLRAQWQAIEGAAAGAQAPARLYGPRDAVASLLVEHLGADPERILVGDQPTLLRARSYLAEWRPGILERLELVPSAFAASGAEEQLAAALEPVVPLAGGGALLIQPTAALTAIDVDSGGDGGGRRALEVDLAAAAEIARQLRLRQIGGTVVIDFVDLAAKADRARLLQALRAALKRDPAASEVLPMSSLGLVQVSRQRQGPSLAEQVGRVCPTCAGAGLLPSLGRSGEALMRALAARPQAGLAARVAPDLHGHLTGAAAAVWQDFGAREGRAWPLRVDPLLAPGGWQIEEAR